jgi:hypothetical protein
VGAAVRQGRRALCGHGHPAPGRLPAVAHLGRQPVHAARVSVAPRPGRRADRGGPRRRAAYGALLRRRHRLDLHPTADPDHGRPHGPAGPRCRLRPRAMDRADRRLPAVGARERRGLAGRIRPPPGHGPLLQHRGRRGGQRPLDPGPGPANRLVRSLYLRFVTLALEALARSGRSLPQRRPSFHSDFQTHEYATPDPAPTSPWSSVAALAAPSGTTPRRPPPTPSPAPSWSICWPMSSPTAATC